MHQARLRIETPGRGLTEISDLVQEEVGRSTVATGLCSVFIRHTSASLLIRLLLGTWQGIYLWEHRHRPHVREVVVTVFGA